MKEQEKICITTGKGMIGTAFKKILKENGYLNVIFADEHVDLFDGAAINDFFQKEKPDYVFMISQKSGSIAANIKYPAEFIYDNLVLQNNIIHGAYLSKVKKMLFLGASCIYPKESLQPIKEEYLLKGEIELTNEAYAVAKIAGVMMCRAYNQQYKTKLISVIPATLYGPENDFDLEKSHVLSALIRKFHEAKINNDKEIILWGSGNPRREFLYINDLIEACIFIMKNENNFDLFNVGFGTDLTIKELSEKIKLIVGFKGEVKWDVSRPDGVMQKLLDSSRLKMFGWKPNVLLDEGIEKTYSWFVDNYNKII